MIRQGYQSIAPSKQHDNAATEDVEPSSLLPESSVEPPLSSKLHGLDKNLDEGKG